MSVLPIRGRLMSSRSEGGDDGISSVTLRLELSGTSAVQAHTYKNNVHKTYNRKTGAVKNTQNVAYVVSYSFSF